MIDIPRLRSRFAAKYGTEPRIFRAPGRINLIGEYTDINDGFVLPAAIDFAMYVAAAPRSDRLLRAASVNIPGELNFDLDEPNRPAEKSWTKYVQGIGVTLEAHGYKLTGADMLIDSDIPTGAGLSSSAALDVGVAFALASLAGHSIDGMELAKIGQHVEHEFAGVRSGIMDQFASVFGQADKALFLDCRSLEWSAVPVSQARFIICNTKASHDLAESAYNDRRSECEAAARFFGKETLRDVTLSEFNERAPKMEDIPMRRARHVISENERVLEAVGALRNDDLCALGTLMDRSHESLRHDFEVSSPELDLMVELARGQKGLLGARMMGGGFGGCTINLMEPGDHSAFIAKMSAGYARETGIVPDIYECVIDRGVAEIE